MKVSNNISLGCIIRQYVPSPKHLVILHFG